MPKGSDEELQPGELARVLDQCLGRVDRPAGAADERAVVGALELRLVAAEAWGAAGLVGQRLCYGVGCQHPYDETRGLERESAAVGEERRAELVKDDLIALPGGRSLAYAEFGDPHGRPVLFFHGTPGYRLNAWATDAELRSLDVRLIALDRPGVGGSTPRAQRRLLDWPDDVEKLADALGLERFAIVGFSNGGPHAAACAFKLGRRTSGIALVAPMPPLDEAGALERIGAPGWYYPLARRAPWALRAPFRALATLARRNPRRAERILLSNMSKPDRLLFAQPQFAGRLGADLAGAGGRGVVDDERVMPLPWGFEPEQVESPVRLWLGERDELVPARMWLEQACRFPVCEPTVVAGAGHFLIAEHMAEIVRDLLTLPLVRGSRVSAVGRPRSGPAEADSA